VLSWGSNVTVTISIGGALILALVALLIRYRRKG
jgi:LPXTG-motif cell wall-anchored protein